MGKLFSLNMVTSKTLMSIDDKLIEIEENPAKSKKNEDYIDYYKLN